MLSTRVIHLVDDPRLVIEISDDVSPPVVKLAEFTGSVRQQWRFLRKSLVIVSVSSLLTLGISSSKGLIGCDSSFQDSARWIYDSATSAIRSESRNLVFAVLDSPPVVGSRVLLAPPGGEAGNAWSIRRSDDLAEAGIVLQPRQLSSFVYPAGLGFRGLLVTDFHLMRRDLGAQISKLVQNLRRAISAHAPTAIFVLGDIIHCGGNPQCYYDVARAIESTGVECHMIPGNHDLLRFRPVVAGWHGQCVSVHMSDIIIVKSENGTRDVVLGHDLGQCKTVRGDKTKKWFRQLRTVYKDSIRPRSLFVVGHIHELHASGDKLSWSIPRFAVDEKEFHFGLLKRNRKGVIKLTVAKFRN